MIEGAYRIMQAGRSSFFVEQYSRNMFGLFPKWRALTHPVPGPFSMTVYFVNQSAAEAYADEHKEFSGGPKVVRA